MRSYSRRTRMWGVAVAGLCVLWFAAPAGAVPLESWDDKIPANKRFKVLSEFNGEAVLDKQTGLVWEQAPDATGRVWQSFGIPMGAANYCVNKNVGGTVGWRLPSVVELKSVQDPTLPVPFVPGTVFTGVQLATYWSATTLAGNPVVAWHVSFGAGFASASGKGDNHLAWCVRGGMNADQY